MRRRLVAHPERMEPVRTPRPWGNMTVPPLFGWEIILSLLLLLVVVAVACFLITAAGPARSERSDWQRFLEARSIRPERPVRDPDDRTAELIGPEAGERART